MQKKEKGEKENLVFCFKGQGKREMKQQRQRPRSRAIKYKHIFNPKIEDFDPNIFLAAKQSLKWKTHM